MFKKLLLISLYLFFGVFINACGGSSGSSKKCDSSPNDPSCVEEQRREVEEQQTKAQEKAKFQSLGECLKAKKAEAGVTKPTAEMLQQCKNSLT